MFHVLVFYVLRSEVVTRYESSTSFDLPMFVGAGLLRFFPYPFQKYISEKKLLAHLVISSGNSHLLSSALIMILNFLWTIESSSLLSNWEVELDDWRRGSFLFPPFFFLIFSFSPFMESLLPWGPAEKSLVSLLLSCC